MEIGDSPPSPVNYWIPELKLNHFDEKILKEGSKLTDKHMDGSASLLAMQFPDMPPPQTTLRAKQPRLLQPAKEGSIFFHNYDEHWVLSHIREGVVYLYNSFHNKEIHPELKEQIVALYGKQTIKVPVVQVQKGGEDCGCFAIAFCVSVLYGDDPASLVYNQQQMREHIANCLANKHFTPFPAIQKKSKRIIAPMEYHVQ